MGRINHNHYKPAVFDWLERWASETPEKPAFFSVKSDDPITYGQLLRQMNVLTETLERLGVRAGDPIALLGPMGPALATATVAVISYCVCVPMNPALTEGEMAEYLARHHVRALIAPPDHVVSRSAAGKTGIPVIDLEEGTTDDGGFVRFAGKPLPTGPDPRHDRDIAVVMQTSGTTSGSKTVLIRRDSLEEVSLKTLEFMEAGPEDRSFSYLPLFHIHSLTMNLFGVISTGGSVLWVPGFTTAQECLGYFHRFSCTWMTAGPAPLKALCEYVKDNPGQGFPSCLHFLGGGGAPISPEVFAEVEETFGVQLLYGWGLTESAGAVTIIPPHRPSRRESVGISFDCEIAILDEEGRELPAGEQGEVVLRGRTLAQYEGEERSPEAWMGTGDQGYLDSDGYLYITGRIKELVNKGGMKISPYEVEDQLLRLPGVLEAACFAIPHPRLGEDVACAVVVKTGAGLTAAGIRDSLVQHLARFKVPSRIIFVDRIPKGPTGKIQRVKLADVFQTALQEDLAAAFVAPRTPVEEKLASIWSQLIGIERVGIEDDFFALGGDSLMVSVLVAELEAEFGAQLPISFILQVNTVEKMAKLLEESRLLPASSIIPLRPEGSKPPLYLMHHANGEVMGLKDLIQTIDPDYPIYAVCFANLFERWKEQGRESVSIREIASHYVDELLKGPAKAPYHLFGHSFGGFLAQEVARQLKERGAAVGIVGLFDTRNLHYARKIPMRRKVWVNLRDRIQAWKAWSRRTFESGALIHDRNNQPVPFGRCLSYLLEEIQQSKSRGGDAHPHEDDKARTIRRLLNAALMKHLPERYGGKITLFRAIQKGTNDFFRDEEALGWAHLAEEIEIVDVPGDHGSMVQLPQAQMLGFRMKECLNRTAG